MSVVFFSDPLFGEVDAICLDESHKNHSKNGLLGGSRHGSELLSGPPSSGLFEVVALSSSGDYGATCPRGFNSSS